MLGVIGMTIEFNINECVYVKITEAGWDRLKKNHYELYEAYKANIYPEFEIPEYENYLITDDDGWTEIQLWRLMNEFGPHIHMGMKEPFFSLDIVIPTN